MLDQMDVLDELDELQICVAYEYNGQRVGAFPLIEIADKVTPIYERFPGWKAKSAGVTSWDALLERCAPLRGTYRRIDGAMNLLPQWSASYSSLRE